MAQQVRAKQMAAENLSFSDESFDYVYGNGVLHHTDFLETGLEIKRVLKKGGRAFFIEPLNYNPIIRLYRHIAHEVRTQDERALSFEDIDRFGRLFRTSGHREFHLLTQGIFLWFFFIKMTSPNKERYWKKIIIEGKRYEKAFSLLFHLDTIILKCVPLMAQLCWNSVIIVQK